MKGLMERGRKREDKGLDVAATPANIAKVEFKEAEAWRECFYRPAISRSFKPRALRNGKVIIISPIQFGEGGINHG